MSAKKTVLVVDDNSVNRKLLCKILSQKYETMQADNGETALDIICSGEFTIDLVLLDLIMPVMDGFEFLKKLSQIPTAAAIPVIVTTQREEEAVELKALSLGAMDFLTKPYNASKILQRVSNILRFREAASLIKAMERDALTGLYTRDIFYSRVKETINSNLDQRYAIVTLDIERFKIINDIFGTDEGDKLLKFIAQKFIANFSGEAVCGRIGGDIFAALVAITPDFDFTLNDFSVVLESVRNYPLNIDVSVKHGVYYIHNNEVPISTMCDRAQLAGESIKGRYDTYFSIYDDSLRSVLLREQQIINDMRTALREDQFKVYYQPKYDLATGAIAGAEALVRWYHPKNEIMSPAHFIPLFEKNGFITDLDIYIWNKVCSDIRKWIDDGIEIVPISVNVSRVDIYNPSLVDILSGMVKRYDIEPKYLHLEITESAYTESAKQIIETIKELHDLGFIIEMDDFGTGYSSLNMLNELPLDILKLDMRFLANHSDESPKNNILNFIISLAKWLDLSVVAEGIETKEQVLFLRNMNCNLGQGYYFAKPMPQHEFEKMIKCGAPKPAPVEASTLNIADFEDIWNPVSQFNTFFNCFVGGLGIFEVDGNSISFIRGNDKLFEVLNVPRDNLYHNANRISEFIFEEDRQAIFADIVCAISNFCEVDNYSRWRFDLESDEVRWLHLKIKLLNNSRDRAIVMASVEDVTERKNFEADLAAQQTRMRSQREFFERIYQSAPCGMAQMSMDGSRYIHANNAMVRMLGFDSLQEFLYEPRSFWDFIQEDCVAIVKEYLPSLAEKDYGSYIDLEYVVVSQNDTRMWVKCLMQKMRYDSDEYIQCVITDITEIKKIENELRESVSRDALTGLLNRDGFKTSIEKYIESNSWSSGAFLMIDLDDFKLVNDNFGHVTGDKVLRDIAMIIGAHLRADDFVSRIGGDEFAVFMKDMEVENDAIILRAKGICDAVAKYKIGHIELSCSVGIAFYPDHGLDYDILYSNADTALYKSKNSGKGLVCIYE